MGSIIPDSIARNGVTFGPTHISFWGWVVVDSTEGCAHLTSALASDAIMSDMLASNVELSDEPVGDVATISDEPVGDVASVSDELVGDAVLDDEPTGTATMEDEISCG